MLYLRGEDMSKNLASEQLARENMVRGHFLQFWTMESAYLYLLL